MAKMAYITITCNTTELHWCTRTSKRPPVAKKSHHWSSMQNCTPFYSPDPSKNTQATLNTKTESATTLHNIIKTQWPNLSQNRAAMAKMAYITITCNTTELHWCTLTSKRPPVAEKSHHWSSMQIAHCFRALTQARTLKPL